MVKWNVYHCRRKSVSAVSETHGAKKWGGLIETEVAVGRGADVADVRGHHRILDDYNLQCEQIYCTLAKFSKHLGKNYFAQITHIFRQYL